MHVKRRKKKVYINVLAPKMFNEVEIGYILANSEYDVVGRILEVSLYKLTKNPLHQFIECKLKISRVSEGKAYTIYYGHEYFREYMKALFTKGTSYIDVYKDVSVKDGCIYRVYAGVFTLHRVNTSKKKAIRREIIGLFNGVNYLNKNEFIKDILFGVIDSKIMMISKKIYPVKWAGVQKIKVVRLKDLFLKGN